MSKPDLIHLIENLKYLGVFAGAFIEGPATGLIAGFLSKINRLDIFYAYIAHATGDFLADVMYYCIGYFSGKKYPRIIKFSESSLSKAKDAKKFFHRHPRKMIIVGKLTHALGLPILIGAGLAHYPWKKFLLYNLFATIIKSAIIVTLGYFFADMWTKAESIFSYITLAGLALLLLFAIYFLAKKSKINEQ